MSFIVNFLLGIIVGSACFWCGWKACDRYWIERIRNRPNSIHLGKYPEESITFRKN